LVILDRLRKGDGWPGYFGAVLGKPPRDTLLAALASFEQKDLTAGCAVDLAAIAPVRSRHYCVSQSR